MNCTSIDERGAPELKLQQMCPPTYCDLPDISDAEKASRDMIEKRNTEHDSHDTQTTPSLQSHCFSAGKADCVPAPSPCGMYLLRIKISSRVASKGASKGASKDASKVAAVKGSDELGILVDL